MDKDGLFMIMFFLILGLSYLLTSGIVRKVGYGIIPAICFVVMGLFFGVLFAELSRFVPIKILNLYLLICIGVKIFYSIIVDFQISEEDKFRAEKDQEDIDFCCGKFISEIDNNNHMMARIKINEKVFGKYSWNNFPDH